MPSNSIKISQSSAFKFNRWYRKYLWVGFFDHCMHRTKLNSLQRIWKSDFLFFFLIHFLLDLTPLSNNMIEWFIIALQQKSIKYLSKFAKKEIKMQSFENFKYFPFVIVEIENRRVWSSSLNPHFLVGILIILVIQQKTTRITETEDMAIEGGGGGGTKYRCGSAIAVEAVTAASLIHVTSVVKCKITQNCC